MRTAILLGIHLNPSDSEVKPSQAQLVLRWETTLEHWVLYAFLLPLFRQPPAVHPTSPLQSASSRPSQPAAHMAHVPLLAAMLPAAPFHANPPPAPS